MIRRKLFGIVLSGLSTQGQLTSLHQMLREVPHSGAVYIRSSIILNWERNTQLVMALKSDSRLIGGLVTLRFVLGLLDSSRFLRILRVSFPSFTGRALGI
jgi:hypothetical protein